MESRILQEFTARLKPHKTTKSNRKKAVAFFVILYNRIKTALNRFLYLTYIKLLPKTKSPYKQNLPHLQAFKKNKNFFNFFLNLYIMTEKICLYIRKDQNRHRKSGKRKHRKSESGKPFLVYSNSTSQGCYLHSSALIVLSWTC